ncbi:hypothetical protein J6590_028646 [Homalodisca vitripennis]|nr:hypothetical protein J6590_028646 [Homalodisca vitripennis]
MPQVIISGVPAIPSVLITIRNQQGDSLFLCCSSPPPPLRRPTPCRLHTINVLHAPQAPGISLLTVRFHLETLWRIKPVAYRPTPQAPFHRSCNKFYSSEFFAGCCRHERGSAYESEALQIQLAKDTHYNSKFTFTYTVGLDKALDLNGVTPQEGSHHKKAYTKRDSQDRNFAF